MCCLLLSLRSRSFLIGSLLTIRGTLGLIITSQIVSNEKRVSFYGPLLFLTTLNGIEELLVGLSLNLLSVWNRPPGTCVYVAATAMLLGPLLHIAACCLVYTDKFGSVIVHRLVSMEKLVIVGYFASVLWMYGLELDQTEQESEELKVILIK